MSTVSRWCLAFVPCATAMAMFIGRAFPQYAGQTFLIATRIAVRYVAWLVALGMMTWTIVGTGIWMHLVLLPLLGAVCGGRVLASARRERPR
jgi:hypothetical protein